MKKHTALMCIAVAAILIPTAAWAKKNVWRDCGIGALLFPKVPVLAVTTNIVWDLGLTGSTSTSSSEDQCAGKKGDAAQFLYQNYAIIEEQTASGQGDYLVTMLDIFGCEKRAHGEILRSLRSDFTQRIQSPGYFQYERAQKAELYFNNVVDNIDGKFLAMCSAG